MDALATLAAAWPWPAERPPEVPPAAPSVDVEDGLRLILARELSSRTRLVVVTGSGASSWARLIASCAPHAAVVAIGASGAVVAECWPLRERVVPMREENGPAGLQAVADAGLAPDAVCLADDLDGSAAAEIELCRTLFPAASIVGGGHERPGVAAAVAATARRHGLTAETRGEGWVLGGRRRPAPWPVEARAAVVSRPAPRLLTFLDPGPATGAHVVARLAEELERRRPDIPILVVGAHPARSLDLCGLDLRARKNLVLAVAGPGDAQRRWSETRLALFPWLGGDLPATSAVEAMLNGVPAVASDRGALPEAVGDGGTILPLPGRLQPGTRWLPSAEEVEPWVRAILRLWDDPALLRSLGEAGRAGALRRSVAGPSGEVVRVPDLPSARPRESVVLVPHLNGIEPKCEDGLRKLEREGVKVVRTAGCSAIDGARNQMASDALHDGFAALLFIDADIAFDPDRALALLARPEPVVAGVYAKKNVNAFTCEFYDGITEVVFGEDAPGPYPLRYASAGFLRIRSEVLRRMIEELRLPLCNTRWGRGLWPFFQPMIVPDSSGMPHYLGEDWSFCARLAEIGVTPLADTTIRLYHLGRHGFGWEDAGTRLPRYRTFRYTIDDRDATGGSPPAS